MGRIYRLITSVLLVLMIVLAVLMVVPKFFGITPLAVLSGSMEPTYHVGSLIYIVKTDPATIKVGDPITFNISADTMVTHRVVAIDEANQTFTTKGDANNTNDGSPVSFSNVVGKPLFTIPLLGYLAVYLSSKSGNIILITLIIVVLILTFLPDLLLKSDKEPDKDIDSNNVKDSGNNKDGGMK